MRRKTSMSSIIVLAFALFPYIITTAEAQNTLTAERYGSSRQCFLKRGSLFSPGSCFLNDALALDHFLRGTDRNIETIQLRISYYAAVHDAESVFRAERELGFWQLISARLLWARAIRDADSLVPNYVALQQYMNVLRAGSVELRPYTDGTMDIYLDESWHSRRQIVEVLEEIVAIHAPDRNWRASVSPNGQDVDWAWDQFRDEYGNNVWRCRGKQSGEFLQDLFCMGQLRSDHTWPG